MEIPIKQDMTNAAVNAMYKNVSDGRGIKASEAAARIADENGDGFISKQEMKNTLNSDRASLSLAEFREGSAGSQVVRFVNSLDVSADVVDRMDKADGRPDGMVKTPAGSIPDATLTAGLVSGEVVIGDALKDREDAGKILELHQNQDGPKIVMGAGSSTSHAQPVNNHNNNNYNNHSNDYNNHNDYNNNNDYSHNNVQSHSYEIKAAFNENFESNIVDNLKGLMNKKLSAEDQRLVIDMSFSRINKYESNLVDVMKNLARTQNVSNGTREYLYQNISEHSFKFSSNKSEIMDAFRN